MNMRDLIPWGRNAQTSPSPYREEGDPFMILHREMNRLFDDVFRGFDIAPFGSFGGMGRMAGWPSVEVIDTDKDVRVSAELPGLDEGCRGADGRWRPHHSRREEVRDR